MANSDKDIKITPNAGSANSPKIEFTGADDATKTLTVADSGALSFNHDLTVDGDLTITGDFSITGDLNTVSATDLDVVDATITIASGASTLALTDAAGIQFGSHASAPTFTWDNTNSRLASNKPISASAFIGALTGSVTGDVSGSSGSTTGNAATVTNGVYTTGNQTIAGTKTFSSAIAGSVTGSSASTTGNAATVTTNANLTGDITSVGNATAIASDVIVNADVKSDAAIAYSKLGTIPSTLLNSNVTLSTLGYTGATNAEANQNAWATIAGVTASSVTDSIAFTASGGMTITGGTDTIDFSSADTTYSVMNSGNSYAAGLVPAGNETHVNKFLRYDGTWVVPENDNTTYNTATATVEGLVELFSNAAQTVAAESVSTTASRSYGIQLNSANQMVVNVPWTDNDTVYTHTTNANLTGDVTSVGNATTIAAGVIVNTDVNASAAIAYSKLNLTGAVLNADLAGSIANAKLSNSAITIDGTSTSLGGSITTNNTTYSVFDASNAGLVPVKDAGGTSTKFLREDGDWVIPTDTTIANTDVDVSVANLKTRLASFTSADTVYIGDADDDTTIVIRGTLQVDGTTTTINTATVEVEDNILQLNTTQAGTDTATAATSGISIYRGDGVTQASLIFDDADDTWDLTNHLNVAGQMGIGIAPYASYDLRTAGSIDVGNHNRGLRYPASSNGTASAPSFTRAADLNTGMYFISSDTLGFTTGGTERLRIADTGLVTIAGGLTVTGTLTGDVTGALTGSASAIDDGAVSSADKFGSGVVDNSAIGALAVDTAELAANAVVEAKVADNAITGGKISGFAINYDSATTTALDGAINESVTSIQVDANHGLPELGTILIDSEFIKYKGINSDVLTVVARGHRGTTAASHIDNSSVRLYRQKATLGGVRQIDVIEFDGADSGAASNPGLVPVAQTGDTAKFLRGDGAWASVASATLDTTNDTTDANRYLTFTTNSATTSGQTIYTSANLYVNPADQELFINGPTSMLGAAKLANGSAGSPSLRFTSDANTGMYRGGTDILGFSTAGTSRMTIAADGAVNVVGGFTATNATLTTPALGTPSALVGTNISGTAANLTAGKVQTNAGASGSQYVAFMNDGLGIGQEMWYDDQFKYNPSTNVLGGGLSIDTTNILISGGQGSDGQVLTSTGSGVAWEAVSGGATSLDELSDVNLASNYSVYYGNSITHDNANYNTSVGSTALDSITTGSGNTCFGAKAGTGITDSTGNILLGSEAGGTIVTGASYNIGIGSSCMAVGDFNGSNYNIGIGAFTMRSCSGGDNNIGIGGWSAKEISSGSNNVGLGYSAIKEITTGTRNIGIGTQALDAATTENDNIAIGYDALGGAVVGGEKNIAIGNYALDAALTGDYNVVMGYQAGTAMTSGYQNTAIGNESGKGITTGYWNTSVGDSSGVLMVGGYKNTTLGTYANRLTGNSNTAVGAEALKSGYSNNGGSQNTAVGATAGYAMGAGINNLMLGFSAGNNITTGNNNVVIGAADVTADASDQLSISSGDGSPVWITGDSAGKIKIGPLTSPVTEGMLTVSRDDATATGPTLLLLDGDDDANNGPSLKLYRDSSSPADNDALGNIGFNGEDDVGGERTYAKISAIAKDVTSGTNDGALQFKTMVAGTQEIVLEIEDGVTINEAYTLPTAVTGTTGHVLTANTNGTTSWAAVGQETITDVTIGSGTSGTTSGIYFGANNEAGVVAGEVSSQSVASNGYIELMNCDLDTEDGTSGLQTIELTVQIQDETNNNVESFKALVQGIEKSVLGTTTREVNYTEWAVIYTPTNRIGQLEADYDSTDDTIRIRYKHTQGSTATLTATFYAVTMQNNT